jgi:hypothetical protein
VLNEVIRYGGGISDTDRADNHYRVIAGNRLQWGGRVRLWDAEPRLIARSLVGDIKRNFPALGEISVAHLWRGTLGRAIHRMPQVGQIEPGLWVASGFGGHGLNATAMAGELIARGIVENDETWRLFAPYELVWAGGKIGRAIAQGLYWGSRPVARVEQELARYREKARERKAVRQAARAAARAAERAKLPVKQAAALNAIADVAEAEQEAFIAAAPAELAPSVAPVTPDDRAAHLEAPAPTKPKEFGRRKRGPRQPKGGS